MIATYSAQKIPPKLIIKLGIFMNIGSKVNQRLLRYLLKKMILKQHEFKDIDDCAGFIAFAIEQVMLVSASEEERMHIIDIMSDSITKN